MRPLLTFSVLIVIVAAAEAVGQPCTSQDQCAADECCQIINIVVASRKRQAQLMPVGAENSGTCEKYKQAGDSCVGYEVLNGFCGCAAGLTCKSVYVGTPAPPPAPVDGMVRRDMRPGYRSYCMAA
ncbi:hypothetical protein BaRGS_00015381 [Batillaria attramentaria]|uniref:Prokineticin domain-containing protein n=1 Tax=Batillaria attramentaria TaxID=370345 RepID=A0ABD0L2A1_9CAEN